MVEIALGISTLPRPVKQEEQNADTDDHVQRVHAGHRKIQEEEELRVLRHVWRQGNPVVGRMNKFLDAEVDRECGARCIPRDTQSLLIPRKTSPSKIVSIRQRSVALCGAHLRRYTPMAMVKLERSAPPYWSCPD